MKKLIKAILVIFLVMQISGCAQSKTTVDTQDEWNELFDLNRFTNVKIKQTGDYKDLASEEETSENDYSDEVTAYSCDNVLQIVFDDSSIYYEKDFENSKIKYYSQIGKDMFTMDEEILSSEEIETEFNGVLASYMLGNYDFTTYYNEATYDENKKCYSFEYNDTENDFTFETEVYPKDSYLAKLVVYFVEEGYSYTLTTEFENYGKVSIKLPTVNNTISNDEEWDNLFDVNKYKNCIVFKDKATYAEQIELEEDLIHYMKYDYETDAYSEYYFEKTDDPYLQNVTEVNEDGTLKQYQGNYGNFEGVQTFDDYYLVNTFEKDFKGYFRRTTWVDDHYEFKINNGNTTKNVSIYVSDGYLVTIMIEEGEGENATFNQISITNFNTTKFSIPDNK